MSHNIFNIVARHGKWRRIFVALALLAVLSGSWSPAALASTSHRHLVPSDYQVLYSDRLPGADLSVAPATRSLQLASRAAAIQPAPSGVSEGRVRYFSQTAHFLRGIFLAYWETHGATAILGLPLTEPIIEDGLTVQYLERARLEYHPENPDPRNQVLLARLGVTLAESRSLSFDQAPPVTETPGSHYFPETGHNLSSGFLTYWLRNGGLAVFGYPISEEMAEVNPADGNTYTVQYFERNRFEWHPQNPPAYNVLLGLLGVEYARMAGLNPLARVIVPEPIGNGEDLGSSPQLAHLVDPDLLPAVQELAHAPQFRWVPALIIQYKVAVEFSAINEEGVAGAFVATRSTTRPYVIVVPESERNESPLALASVLAHEATHAYDTVAGVIRARSGCSIEEELRAYMNGFSAWIVLQGENALEQDYPARSLDAAINRSLVGFNSGNTNVSFDFSAQDARSYLRTLYGSSCGQ